MLKVHPKQDASKFVCDVCEFSTFAKHKLRIHKYEKHEKEKHKPCPHCDSRRPYNGALQIHIDRRHPEHDEKQFFCDVCGKGFIFKASLTDHPVQYCHNHPRFKGRPDHKRRREKEN